MQDSNDEDIFDHEHAIPPRFWKSIYTYKTFAKPDVNLAT